MDYRRAWAEIDINRLTNNVRAVRGAIPKGTRMLAAVKADAYGHGAAEVAQTLLENGADTLGVALCEEGISLRKSGIKAPILVMSYTPDPLLKAVVEYDLVQTIFSAESYMPLAKEAKKADKKAEVHIKIDTGMGRLGFLPSESAADKICSVMQEPALNVTGIYTHFATSDAIKADFMYEQCVKFGYMLKLLKKRGVPVDSLLKHAGNSGMLAQQLREDYIITSESNNDMYQSSLFSDMSPDMFSDMSPDMFPDMFLDMVRIGIMLYGLPPSAEMGFVCDKLGLKPVMRLMSRVSMTKSLPAGSGVSYGHLFKTDRETIVATLPIGYADGYPRLLSNKGKVFIKGKLAPIIGAICMDQLMVDVTDVPDPWSIKPGDEVIMFGDPGPGAEELAAQIGTIGYELLCGIGKRVPRIYLKNNPN